VRLLTPNAAFQRNELDVPKAKDRRSDHTTPLVEFTRMLVHRVPLAHKVLRQRRAGTLLAKQDGASRASAARKS